LKRTKASLKEAKIGNEDNNNTKNTNNINNTNNSNNSNNTNEALYKSFKDNQKVRVFRSSNAKSMYAPRLPEGKTGTVYRYDGLFYIDSTFLDTLCSSLHKNWGELPKKSEYYLFLLYREDIPQETHIPQDKNWSAKMIYHDDEISGVKWTYKKKVKLIMDIPKNVANDN
jgi:SAD/SRA domain